MALKNPYTEVKPPWQQEPNKSVLEIEHDPDEIKLIDPTLRVPASLLESSRDPNPLREMLGAIDEDFNRRYWPEQRERIEEWGGVVVADKRHMTSEESERVLTLGSRRLPVLDRDDKQEGFTAELVCAKTVVERVLDLHEKDPLTKIVVLFDMDETVGQIPERQDGGDDIEYSGEADIDAFVIRSAFRVMTEYLAEQKGLDIAFGLISTKDQKWLERFYNEKLRSQQLFDEDLLISSRDGRFVAQMQEEIRLMRGGHTIAEVYSPEHFPGYAILPQAMNLTPYQLKKSVTAYDIKPLMSVRLQHEPEYAATTVITVDDWGLMSLYTNQHSDQQAVALDSIGAKFATPDMSWARSVLELQWKIKATKSSLQRLRHLARLRSRFVAPNTEWAAQIQQQEIEARDEAAQYLRLLRPRPHAERVGTDS